ncbi:predicted protein [Micromonas commoda]|uniref:Uncharacterized protein n=1 Tax=Micromonas commoda (strain RCC299 / NOUM17 / CCMP2709) TaxID=296587 RepID=C1FJR5_MICCC|nr:predicted protein [Micromonas commoda]ACO70648.1 predicted protein [Micromonas commoda]|eukprot:XP_002509390.1 predicted protein [Micromonas commoda]
MTCSNPGRAGDELGTQENTNVSRSKRREEIKSVRQSLKILFGEISEWWKYPAGWVSERWIPARMELDTIYVGAAPHRASQHGSSFRAVVLGHRTPRASLGRVPCSTDIMPHRSRVGPAARAHGTRRKTQLCATPTPSFVPRHSAQTALTLQQGTAQGDVVHTRLPGKNTSGVWSKSPWAAR